jgi:hypothetical protein
MRATDAHLGDLRVHGREHGSDRRGPHVTRRGEPARRGAGEAARRDAPLESSPTGGVRTLLEALPREHGKPAASFDTRFDKSALLTGPPAGSIARRLESQGYRLVARPESFFVSDTEGPLPDGELDRARIWGASLLVLAGTLPSESCG